MPKKSAKQTDSDEDYAEAQSQPELDPGSLEAVLARVIGPLQAQLAEQGLAQAKLAKEFAEAKAASEAWVIGFSRGRQCRATHLLQLYVSQSRRRAAR